jgi:hypothetical protein
VVTGRDEWFHGRVYSRKLRGRDWTWRSNIIVVWECVKHIVSPSREIYGYHLDKVNRLSLSVGEITVKAMIVPLSTAKISEVGRSFRQARPLTLTDAPAPTRTTTFTHEQLIHPQHHLLFALYCSLLRDRLYTLDALASTDHRPRHRQSHSAKTLRLTRITILAHAWTTPQHVFITSA